MEPVVKKEHTALKATEPVAKNEHEAMVKTKFGLRKAITSTPFEKGKTTILGGGPLVEFVFDDSYREESRAYMQANGLKGLSASRWA